MTFSIVLLLSRTILASFAEDEVKNKVSQAVKLSMNNSLVATYLHFTIGGGGKSANLPPFFAKLTQIDCPYVYSCLNVLISPLQEACKQNIILEVTFKSVFSHSPR